MLEAKKNLTESYKCFQLVIRLLKSYTFGMSTYLSKISLHITRIDEQFDFDNRKHCEYQLGKCHP